MKAILPKRTPKVEKEKRIRKKTGNKPGSRQDVEFNQSNKSGQSSGNRDPRLGSKKPIALGVAQSTQAKPEVKPTEKLQPIAPVRVIDNREDLEQELLALENNESLQALAASEEAGEELSEAQQSELQAGLARYQQLVSELGLEQEQDVVMDESSEVSEDVLWDKLDDYDFSDYKEDKEE